MATIRSREVYKAASVTLVAVESIDIRPGETGLGFHVIATIEPIAVIVTSPDETYALGMDGQALDLDRLRQSIPDTWIQ